jgi:hypothetical protein
MTSLVSDKTAAGLSVFQFRPVREKGDVILGDGLVKGQEVSCSLFLRAATGGSDSGLNILPWFLGEPGRVLKGVNPLRVRKG